MISLPGFRLVLLVLGSLLAVTCARAESLSFATLKENEAIIVNYESSGCFHHYERKYVVRGSSRLGLDIFEPRARDQNSGSDGSGPDQFLVRAELTKDELAGLDSYLTYLRSVTDAGCTTIENLAFAYYRNDVKIGEEMLIDASCALNIHWADGKLVYDETRPPSPISRQLYKTIVTPQLLERRAAKTLN